MSYNITKNKNSILVEVSADSLQNMFRESFFALNEVFEGSNRSENSNKVDQKKKTHTNSKDLGCADSPENFDSTKCGGACMKDCFLGCSFTSLEDRICGFDSMIVRRVDVSSLKIEDLFLKFMNELIDMSNTNSEVYVNLEFLIFSEEKIIADVFPFSFENEDHKFKKIAQKDVEFSSDTGNYCVKFKLFIL